MLSDGDGAHLLAVDHLPVGDLAVQREREYLGLARGVVEGFQKCGAASENPLSLKDAGADEENERSTFS